MRSLFFWLCLTGPLVTSGTCFFSSGQTAPPGPPLTPETAATRPGDLWQVATGTLFSAPSSAELLSGVTRSLSPRWRLLAPLEPLVVTGNRPRAALMLGALSAHMDIGVELRDASWIRQISQDMVTLERTLGIGDRERPRFTRLSQLAESSAWAALKQEIQACQIEQRDALEQQRDEELGRLISLGTWMGALRWEAKAYEAKALAAQSPRSTAGGGAPPPTAAPELASLSVDMIAWMRRVHDGLSQELKKEPGVRACASVFEQLTTLREAPPTPPEEPSKVSRLSSLLETWAKELNKS